MYVKLNLRARIRAKAESNPEPSSQHQPDWTFLPNTNKHFKLLKSPSCFPCFVGSYLQPFIFLWVTEPDLQRTTVIQEFVLSFSDWPVYNRRRKNQKTCLLVQRKESSEKDLGGWRSQTSFTMRSLESVGVTLQFEHSNPVTAAAVVPSRRSHQQTQHFDILEATLIKMSSSSSLSRSLSLSLSLTLSLSFIEISTFYLLFCNMT